jgi:hypothetical protein
VKRFWRGFTIGALLALTIGCGFLAIFAAMDGAYLASFTIGVNTITFYCLRIAFANLFESSDNLNEMEARRERYSKLW